MFSLAIVAVCALGLTRALSLGRLSDPSTNDAAANNQSAGKGPHDEPRATVAPLLLHAGLRKFPLSYASPTGEQRERPVFLWYPTTAEAPRFDYRGQIGFAALDAPVADGRHPLLVFSHGFLGAADQTIFLMEELARRGYVVAALDHADSGRSQHKTIAWPNFLDAKTWDDAKFVDRRQDVTALLDHLLLLDARDDSFLHQRVAADKIGALGHSLGGYTVLGMAGARPAWRDDRLRAALLMSPFVMPYETRGDLSAVKVPVMLQGGTLDWGITPTLPAVYDKLSGPKHYLVLKNETHFGWTNLVSLGKTTTECLQQGNAELIARYSVAFFERYLNDAPAELLEQSNPRLETYRFAPPAAR